MISAEGYLHIKRSNWLKEHMYLKRKPKNTDKLTIEDNSWELAYEKASEKHEMAFYQKQYMKSTSEEVENGADLYVVSADV